MSQGQDTPNPFGQILDVLIKKGLVQATVLDPMTSIERTRAFIERGHIRPGRVYSLASVTDITSSCMLPAEAFIACYVHVHEHPTPERIDPYADQALAWRINPAWWRRKGGVLMHPDDPELNTPKQPNPSPAPLPTAA